MRGTTFKNNYKSLFHNVLNKLKCIDMALNILLIIFSLKVSDIYASYKHVHQGLISRLNLKVTTTSKQQESYTRGIRVSHEEWKIKF